MAEDNNQIIIATQEGRELNRIRNSTSFKIGVIFTNVIKKPWRIPLLPIDLINLFRNNSKLSAEQKGENILLIGLDTKGTYHSKLACKLQENDNFKNCFLITSQFEGEVKKKHSIIPGPRELAEKSPKGWNLMVERYISSYISNNKIGKIILISDYPFKGILDIIKNKQFIETCWVKTALPQELDKQTSHAEKLFDLILDSDNISITGADENVSNFALQRRGSRKNILIDLPGKLERGSSKITKEIRKILEGNFEVDIFQISYGSDLQTERMIPKKYLPNIEWSSVDLLISDGSIRSQKNISNSNCHVICIPDKKQIRDRQLERFSEKSLDEDIIVLNNPHNIAMLEAFENLLRYRPSKGQKRRKINHTVDLENHFNLLVEWSK